MAARPDTASPRLGRERTQAQPRGPAAVAGWLGWTGLGVAALAGAEGSGVSGLLSLSGVYLIVVAVIALIRGRVGWAHLRTRAAGAAALSAAVALTVLGGATTPPPQDTRSATPAPSPGSSPAAGPAAAGPSRPTTATTPNPTTPTRSATTATLNPATAATGSALAAAATLTVKGRAPKTGYSREQFGPAWFDTDGNGCDTRNDILRRDLVHRVMANGCTVLAGTRAPDPYTGTTIRFRIGGTSEIDIDHVVALADAWHKGAARWSAGTRLAFANDPLNLLAVSTAVNRAKSDGDVATWLPPNKASRCAYVARIVAVKVKYRVWVTEAEREAMVRVLSTCPTTALPGPGTAPTFAALPHPVSTPAPAPPSAPGPLAPASVYYRNCDAARAAGAAPILAGQPGYRPALDRDHDGRACE